MSRDTTALWSALELLPAPMSRWASVLEYRSESAPEYQSASECPWQPADWSLTAYRSARATLPASRWAPVVRHPPVSQSQWDTRPPPEERMVWAYWWPSA